MKNKETFDKPVVEMVDINNDVIVTSGATCESSGDNTMAELPG